MPEFTGSLRLAGDPTIAVTAEVMIDDEHLVVRSGPAQIGDWARQEIEIDASAEGFRLRADGEDLILDVTDPEGFAAAVGIPAFEPHRDEPAESGTLRDEPAESGPRRIKPAAGRRGRRPFPTADSLSSRFAAGYRDDTTLRPILVWPLLGSAMLLGVGALLGWGPFHLIGDSTFPLARVVGGVAAVAAVIGVYLASRHHQRSGGVPVIVAAAVLSLLVLYAFANEAGLHIGFLLSFIGVLGLGALGGIAMTDWGTTPRHSDDDD